ncbi:hypothetical protein HK098_003998 [Nowakowskiella sp. JEL0407]|nr:hypothetical protein HK098_003998 [Nowakowskiella sp. JEL0407]
MDSDNTNTIMNDLARILSALDEFDCEDSISSPIPSFHPSNLDSSTSSSRSSANLSSDEQSVHSNVPINAPSDFVARYLERKHPHLSSVSERPAELSPQPTSSVLSESTLDGTLVDSINRDKHKYNRRFSSDAFRANSEFRQLADIYGWSVDRHHSMLPYSDYDFYPSEPSLPETDELDGMSETFRQTFRMNERRSGSFLSSEPSLRESERRSYSFRSSESSLRPSEGRSYSYLSTPSIRESIDGDSFEDDRSVTTYFQRSPALANLKISMFDFDVTKETITFKRDENEKQYVESGTVIRFIDYLTSEIDQTFLTDFFIVYRIFITPEELLNYLILRFKWACQDDDEKRKLVRVRTFVVLRHWITFYWMTDFQHVLDRMLKSFLEDINRNSIDPSSKIDQRIIATLQGTIDRAAEVTQAYKNRVRIQKQLEEDIEHVCALAHKEYEKMESSSLSPLDHSLIQENADFMSVLGMGTEERFNQTKTTKRANSSHRRSSSVFGSGVLPTFNESDPESSLPILSRKQSILLRSAQSFYNLKNKVSAHLKNRQSSSFVLKYRSDDIVKQFCLLEQKLFMDVSWLELTDPENWRNNKSLSLDREGRVARIGKLIDRFNLTSQWVVSEILCTENLDERARVVSKFIRIAHKCFAYNNFSTLMQIALGLQSSLIDRLKHTWAKISPTEKRIRDLLIQFTLPFKNFKFIRDRLHSLADEIVPEDCLLLLLPETSAENITPAVPFTGLLLNDLFKNSEKPVFLPNEGKAEDCPPVVNFGKFRYDAEIIRRFRSFQSQSRRYAFEFDKEIYGHVMFLKVVDYESLTEFSYVLEP